MGRRDTNQMLLKSLTGDSKLTRRNRSAKTEAQKIRTRIRGLERKLAHEKEEFGGYDDSYGKRLVIGPLYTLMNDWDGALKYYRWYEPEFPDDGVEPLNYLCWALALYRVGDRAAAARKLGQAMLSNIYLLPHMLGEQQFNLGTWGGCSDEWPSYVREIEPEYYALWAGDALEWVRRCYHSPVFTERREKCIEIRQKLKTEPVGRTRSRLVDAERGLSDTFPAIPEPAE